MSWVSYQVSVYSSTSTFISPLSTHHCPKHLLIHGCQKSPDRSFPGALGVIFWMNQYANKFLTNLSTMPLLAWRKISRIQSGVWPLEFEGNRPPAPLPLLEGFFFLAPNPPFNFFEGKREPLLWLMALKLNPSLDRFGDFLGEEFRYWGLAGLSDDLVGVPVVGTLTLGLLGFSMGAARRIDVDPLFLFCW